MDSSEIKKWAPLGACFASEDPRWLEDSSDVHQLPSDMQLTCDQCLVKSLCLKYAMDTEQSDGESGFWGGTSPFQRQQLKRDRSRVKCPGCGSDAVVADFNGGEICISCGISWKV